MLGQRNWHHAKKKKNVKNLQDACIIFPRAPRLPQAGVVLTITQNDSLFVFRFAGSLDDKMKMHACV